MANENLDTVGYWTEVKLSILRDYSNAYAQITDIRDQCRKARLPFFFKQWGGVNKKKAGRLLQGRTWDEMPMAFTRAEAGTR